MVGRISMQFQFLCPYKVSLEHSHTHGLGIIYSCFLHALAELGSCDSDQMTLCLFTEKVGQALL